VSRELESWFAECAFEVWPTYRTFVRGGRKGLHAAVMRRGGPQRCGTRARRCARAPSTGTSARRARHRAPLAPGAARASPTALSDHPWLRRHGPQGLPPRFDTQAEARTGRACCTCPRHSRQAALTCSSKPSCGASAPTHALAHPCLTSYAHARPSPARRLLQTRQPLVDRQARPVKPAATPRRRQASTDPLVEYRPQAPAPAHTAQAAAAPETRSGAWPVTFSKTSGSATSRTSLRAHASVYR
jgi:hypothetical protein